MELLEEILELVKKSQNIKDKNEDWVIIGKIGDVEAEVIREKTGLDVTEYDRMIDVSAIRHARNRHTNLEDIDFCLIPLIVSSYDSIEKGDNELSIVYTKSFENTYYYVEYVRKGRKRLAMKTFYKIKNRDSHRGI